MKNLIFITLALLLAGCGADSFQPSEPAEASKEAEVAADSETAAAEEVVEETPVQKTLNELVTLVESGKAFDVGSYIPGDIPEGEYAFIPLTADGGYFAEKEMSGDILDNENFDSFGYVYVAGVGNVQTDGVLIKEEDVTALGFANAKELFELLTSTDLQMGSAYYKVGKDIPAGTYVATAEAGDGYVAIMSGPIGKSDIVDNEIFTGRFQFTVQDGQYLKLSDATIEQ